MGNKSTPSGTHAEAFAEVAEVLAAKEESIVTDAIAQAEAAGLAVISRIVNAATREVKLIGGVKRLRKEVAERDDQLFRAANLRHLTDMRRNIDKVLAEHHPELAKSMGELVEMENQLRAKDRRVDGVLISAAPPNHPLVERIRIKKQGIQAITSRSLAALDEMIHFQGLEDADALEASRLENALWKVYKSGSKRE